MPEPWSGAAGPGLARASLRWKAIDRAREFYLLGLTLLAGNLLHLWGFGQYPGQYTTPMLGTVLISLVYATACLIGLGQFLGAV